MEIRCGECGKVSELPDGTAGEGTPCPHCHRPMTPPRPGLAGQDVDRLGAEDDMADDFLTKARLALKKKMLVICGSCQERLTVDQRLAGTSARCPGCGGKIRIPASFADDKPFHTEDVTAVVEEQAESDLTAKNAAGAAAAAKGSAAPPEPKVMPKPTAVPKPTATTKQAPPAKPASPGRADAPVSSASRRLAPLAPPQMAGIGVGIWIIVGLLTILLAGVAGFLMGYLSDVPARPGRPRADNAAAKAAATQPAKTTVQDQTP